MKVADIHTGMLFCVLVGTGSNPGPPCVHGFVSETYKY